jgi:hypothetical protein
MPMDASNWNITSGPRHYNKAQDGADIDVGWIWTIERAIEMRDIRVEVAGGRPRLADLPPDSVYAIRTRGRSAVEQHLNATNPPARIKITTAGLLDLYA